jgi:hypothetical protein
VTGSFNLDILLEPEGTQTESVKMLVDLRSNLQVNVTVSGLTLGFDFGFGTTGIEFGILRLFTSIGAFVLSDQFVFATPFYRTLGGVGGANIHPTMTSGGVINGPAFVKKRVLVSSNVAGVSISVLAIFEDVDFPNPFLTTDPVYNIDQVDSIIGNQTPTYGFGTLITLAGQTVSGIRINARTGLCIQQTANIIKGRAWPESVNKACTASIGNNFDNPIEGGAKTPLLFDFHNFSIRDLFFGDNIKMSLDATWKPNTGLEGSIQTDIDLVDFLDIRLAVSFENLMNLSIRSITTQIFSDNLRLTLVDQGGDLSIETLVAVFSITLNPNQNPASLTSTTTLTEGTGLAGQAFSLQIRRGPFDFTTTTAFGASSNANGSDVEWSGTFFSASFRPTEAFTAPSIEAVFGYAPQGTLGMEFNIGITF